MSEVMITKSQLEEFSKFSDPQNKLLAAVAQVALDAQQKLDAVLAENVSLKSGAKYFSYSEFSGFEEHSTAKLAMEHADADLAGERDEASSEGWSEETSTICWGVISQKAVEDKFEKPSEQNGWIGWSDFTLTPALKTPATDTILNEVRAEGIEILTGKLQQLIDEGAFDAKEIGVAAGAVDAGNFHAAQLRAGKDGE